MSMHEMDVSLALSPTLGILKEEAFLILIFLGPLFVGWKRSAEEKLASQGSL